MTSGSQPLQRVDVAASVTGVTTDPRDMTAPPGIAADSSVRRKAASGAVWVFLAFAILKVLGFANNIILARLLVPEHFGLVSFAMVVIGVCKLFQELGVPAALIYSRRDINVIGGTAFTINMGAATILMIGVIALSPLLARLGDDPQIAPLTAVLSIGLLFTASGSVQRALLMKEMAFRRKFLPDVGSVLAEATVAGTLALLGFGVWSLVIGYLTLTLTETLILWTVSPVRPRPRFDRTAARELIGYGKHVSFNSVLGSTANNVDYLIIGASLGAHSLGIYTMAFMIASLPMEAITQVVKTAMFPAYSRLRDNVAELIHLFEDVFAVVWSLSIATGVIIFICAPTYMTILLGDKWESIDEPLRILTIYGVFRSVGAVFSPAYRALGRPQTDWWFTLVRLALVVPLMLFMVRYDVNGVASVHVLVFGLLVPMNAWVFSRFIDVPPGRLARLIAPQALGVLLIALLIAAVEFLPALDDIESSVFGPAALAAVSLAIYTTIVLFFHRRVLAHVRHLLARVSRGRGRVMRDA